METVLKAIADWIKGILTAGIMSNLSGLFDDVNTQVGNIAQQVGTKPSSFEPRVFAMIEALSRNVVLPIAGIILTFIACYELIEMITQHNNMAQFEPALIMRWIFKTAVSVWLISNTFDIVMAVFDITQKVVSDSSGIIAGNTRVNDIGLSMLQSSLMQMDVALAEMRMPIFREAPLAVVRELYEQEQDEPKLSDGELDALPISAVMDRKVQNFPDAAALDEALNTEPAPEPAGNFHITDDDLGVGGPKQKFARNIEAIRTLFKLEEEHRGATAEEQQVLAQYVGWGGLADAFDSNKENWSAECTQLKELLSEDAGHGHPQPECLYPQDGTGRLLPKP